jgi:hypothetical protein
MLILRLEDGVDRLMWISPKRKQESSGMRFQMSAHATSTAWTQGQRTSCLLTNYMLADMHWRSGEERFQAPMPVQLLPKAKFNRVTNLEKQTMQTICSAEQGLRHATGQRLRSLV